MAIQDASTIIGKPANPLLPKKEVKKNPLIKELIPGCVARHRQSDHKSKVLGVSVDLKELIVFGKPLKIWHADSVSHAGHIGDISEAEIKLMKTFLKNHYAPQISNKEVTEADIFEYWQL